MCNHYSIGRSLSGGCERRVGATYQRPLLTEHLLAVAFIEHSIVQCTHSNCREYLRDGGYTRAGAG